MESKRKLILLAVVCAVILIASIFVYLQLFQPPKSSWMASGDFVVYQQDFQWAGGNATEYMFWNITALNGDTADIHLVSHGVNVTNGQVYFPTGDVTLTINVVSREVLTSNELVNSLPVLTNEMPVGSKWPFWIPTNVRVGDSVETSYGNGFINPSQPINALYESRSCWLVSYGFMDRFYDTHTGICLSIQSHVVRNGVTVSVNETAVQTNIELA
jgi:hypothetical protein